MTNYSLWLTMASASLAVLVIAAARMAHSPSLVMAGIIGVASAAVVHCWAKIGENSPNSP